MQKTIQSKFDPYYKLNGIIIEITKNWMGESKEIDWILKHRCRSLLKQANEETLKLFGLVKNDKVDLKNFKVLSPKVKLTESVEFNFEIVNTDNIPHKLRVEYGLYYQKSNGTLSKKVYKISEKVYPSNSTSLINRKQSFKLISTRKFHLGQHQISIIINGVESDKKDFELVAPQ